MHTAMRAVTDRVVAERPFIFQRIPAFSRARLQLIVAMLPLVALAVSWSVPDSVNGAAELCLMLGLLLAAATDVRCHKIFNWTTYPLIVWSVVLATVVTALRLGGCDAAWVGNVGLLGAVAGMMCCGGLTLVAYFSSGGGAGDVKLALVVGGLMGAEQGLIAVGLAYILAAVSALLLSVADASTFGLLSGMARKLGSKFSPLVPPPSTQQEHLLLRKTPLAGYFAVAAWLVMQ